MCIVLALRLLSYSMIISLVRRWGGGGGGGGRGGGEGGGGGGGRGDQPSGTKI